MTASRRQTSTPEVHGRAPVALRLALVTCTLYPDLNASETLYAEALQRRGCIPKAVPWNGPMTPFQAADAIIFRSNWDFHYDPEAFVAWVEGLKSVPIPVLNPPDLVLWNVNKHYLLNLGARGVAIPRSRIVANDAMGIAAVFDEFGWKQAIIKPTVGASGHDVELISRQALDAPGDTQPWTRRNRVLVQEYLPEVSQSGEISCVFFDGEFSHALLRHPAAGDFRVNSRYGGATERLPLPTETVEQARVALTVLPEMPLYARVDGVLRGHQFLLTELELNEPDLDMHLFPEAAERFADATLARLRAT